MESKEPEDRLVQESAPARPETAGSLERDRGQQSVEAECHTLWAVPAGLGREATQLAHEVVPRSRPRVVLRARGAALVSREMRVTESAGEASPVGCSAEGSDPGREAEPTSLRVEIIGGRSREAVANMREDAARERAEGSAGRTRPRTDLPGG